MLALGTSSEILAKVSSSIRIASRSRALTGGRPIVTTRVSPIVDVVTAIREAPFTRLCCHTRDAPRGPPARECGLARAKNRHNTSVYQKRDVHRATDANVSVPGGPPRTRWPFSHMSQRPASVLFGLHLYCSCWRLAARSSRAGCAAIFGLGPQRGPRLWASHAMRALPDLDRSRPGFVMARVPWVC